MSDYSTKCDFENFFKNLLENNTIIIDNTIDNQINVHKNFGILSFFTNLFLSCIEKIDDLMFLKEVNRNIIFIPIFWKFKMSNSSTILEHVVNKYKLVNLIVINN